MNEMVVGGNQMTDLHDMIRGNGGGGKNEQGMKMRQG